MNSFGLQHPRGRAPLRERYPRLKLKLLESIAVAFSLRCQDSLLPINYLGKRRAETAKKPSEFDLSFLRTQKWPRFILGKNRASIHLG